MSAQHRERVLLTKEAMNAIYKLLLPILAFVMLQGGTALGAPPSSKLDLTPDEIRFIKEHPVVTLGTAESFDPFAYQEEDGSYRGYDIDIAQYISEKTGLKIRFVIGNWKKIVRRAEIREIDGLSCSLPSPKRAKYFNFTIPYAEYSSIVIVRKHNPKKIFSMKDLDGKRAAIMAGNINSFNDIQKTGANIEVIVEPELYGAIRSVVMGKSDFMIGGEPVHYLAAKLGLAGFVETAFPTGDTAHFSFSLRNDHPELVSIFNKALKSIPQKSMVTIRNKWLSGAEWEPVTRDGRIKLTPLEQDFLSVSHSLGVCVEGKQLPLSLFTSSGKLDGMDADFIRLAEKNLGPGVKLLPVQSSAPIKDLVNKKCDLAISCRLPAQPVANAVFTTPYLSFPYVIVATNDKQYQTEFLPEPGQYFGVLQGSPVLSVLKNAYPKIHLRELASINAGLQAVRNKKLFGFLAPSVSVTHQIQNRFLTELKILGQLDFTADYAVATRKSPPHLHLIFQKIVGNLGNEEIRRIVNKWVAVKYETGLDYSLLWKIVVAAALLLGGSIFWNRKLGTAKLRAEKALAAEREAIKANINFMDMISHEYRSPLTVISANLDLLEEKIKDGHENHVGKELGRMRNATRRLLNIFEKSLAQIRLDSATIRPNMQHLDILQIVQSAIQDIHHAHPEHDIRLHQSDAAPLVIHADPELFNVVVLNILDNSCKYSKAGSPVDVSLATEESAVILVVQDHGTGINGDDLEHIFEKYYRSPNVGKKRGIGVGMHLVKKIADLHDWKISVTSNEKDGATVTITISLAHA